MKKYIISPIELIPKGKGYFALQNNKFYKNLLEMKREMENARNSMEPHFQKYGSLFRSSTSNFGSFKSTRFHISKRFNTPSVSNSWIIMYEIISYYNIIPEQLSSQFHEPDSMPVDGKFIHFNSENLPGSTILPVHHFIHTMRNKDFRFGSYWFSSAPVHSSLYGGDDIYNLVIKYPESWSMKYSPVSGIRKHKEKDETEKQKVSHKFNKFSLDERNIPIDTSTDTTANKYVPNGDVTDPRYSKHVKKWLAERMCNQQNFDQADISTADADNKSVKVCLFTGNICVEIGKNYNLEEVKSNKLFLGQLYLCCNILKKNGNAILRNSSFFSLFNISMLAWISLHFEEFIICKPLSSKKDSSEIFLVCKGFKGVSKKDLTLLENVLNYDEYDYNYGQLLRLNKITSKFWSELNKASEIFNNQIDSIKYNILNFDAILNKHKAMDSEFNPNKILEVSKKMFAPAANLENINWGKQHPMKPLHQNDWIDGIHNPTRFNRPHHRESKNTSVPFRTRDSYRGRGRGRGRRMYSSPR